MSISKAFLALALFVSSVSYEQQVLQTKNGLSSSWDVTVNVSNSYALQVTDFTLNFE